MDLTREEAATVVPTPPSAIEAPLVKRSPIQRIFSGSRGQRLDPDRLTGCSSNIQLLLSRESLSDTQALFVAVTVS